MRAAEARGRSKTPHKIDAVRSSIEPSFAGQHLSYGVFSLGLWPPRPSLDHIENFMGTLIWNLEDGTNKHASRRSQKYNTGLLLRHVTPRKAHPDSPRALHIRYDPPPPMDSVSALPYWSASKFLLVQTKSTMPCRKLKRHIIGRAGKRCTRRKKVVRKNGKRYYRAGKSGLVRLKGNKKPPRVKR